MNLENASSANRSTQADLERAMWNNLDMDTLGSEMVSGKFAPNNQIVMGTGRTNNACEMCSNSLTTSGCGGC